MEVSDRYKFSLACMWVLSFLITLCIRRWSIHMDHWHIILLFQYYQVLQNWPLGFGMFRYFIDDFGSFGAIRWWYGHINAFGALLWEDFTAERRRPWLHIRTIVVYATISTITWHEANVPWDKYMMLSLKIWFIWTRARAFWALSLPEREALRASSLLFRWSYR